MAIVGAKKKAKGGGVKTQPRKEKCGECANSLTDCDSWAQCEVCEKWFHTKCQNISDEVYSLIQENDGVHWYCKSCDRVFKLLSSMSLFQERQDKMEKEIEAFQKETKKEFNDIKGEITQIMKNQGN